MLQQEIFLQQLGQSPIAKKPFSEHLASLLDISVPSAYNRLSGKCKLTLDEALLLCDFFQVSFDQFRAGSSVEVKFNFPPLNRRQPFVGEYLHLLHEDLVKLNKIEGVQIRYASSEIPVFYYFHVPTLAAFKLYLWGRTIWNDPAVEGKPFSNKDWGGLFNMANSQLMNAIRNQYSRIPSVELWHTHILDNTLNQIKYFSEQGLIMDDETTDALFTSVESLLDLLENFAQKGKKWVPELSEKTFSSPLAIHHNETTHTNNTVLVTSLHHSVVYFSYDNPNFMHSTDTSMVNYTATWFDKMFNHSPMISTHGVTYRIRMFNLLRGRLRNMRDLFES